MAATQLSASETESAIQVGLATAETEVSFYRATDGSCPVVDSCGIQQTHYETASLSCEFAGAG